jgi:hypothetical protein
MLRSADYTSTATGMTLQSRTNLMFEMARLPDEEDARRRKSNGDTAPKPRTRRLLEA